MQKLTAEQIITKINELHRTYWGTVPMDASGAPDYHFSTWLTWNEHEVSRLFTATPAEDENQIAKRKWKEYQKYVSDRISLQNIQDFQQGTYIAPFDDWLMEQEDK